jgi:type IV pilus assembly protein PilQ
MTATRGLVLFVTVATAGALLRAADRTIERPAGSPVAVARLKAISAKVHAKGASLIIEATEPVGYVTAQPDPLTLTLDFRNVAADGVANSVAANPKSPITGVTIEPADSLGAPASRVRIALTQPVAHRVRSDRNTIIIEFDKPAGKGGAPYVLPPASRQTPDAMMALQAASTELPASATQGAASNTPIADPITLSPASQAPSAPALRLALGGAFAQAAGSTTLRPDTGAPAQTPGTQPDSFATQRTGERRFSGHPISLDFQGADLRAVLRVFAETSGLNIVIDPAVQGSVDVQLRDVPWDQALDIILRANKLGYVVDGTIVRIAPLTVLKLEEDEKKALLEAQNDASAIATLQRQLSYAKGEDVAALLKTTGVLTKRGQANVDPRTNTLIVRDVPNQFTEITALIDAIDRAQPQVEIEARIVQTNKNFARALGVQWGFGGQVSPALGNTPPLAFPNNGSLSGIAGAGAAGVPAGTVVNLPVAGAPTAARLSLGSVNGAFNLDVALTALESSGNGRILSTPRVTTQNNIPAEMTQGVQIPIQTVANNTVTVSFRDAALTLRVTPQITAANTVIMQINLENASPDFSRAVNGVPPINTQRAITQVLVSDGQTTVIGGIYVSTEQAQTDKTPGVSRIPLLGWLFKRDSLNDQSTELLVFITPRIIKS